MTMSTLWLFLKTEWSLFNYTKYDTWNAVLVNLLKNLRCNDEVKQTGMHLDKRHFLSTGQVILRTENCSSYFSMLQPTHYLYHHLYSEEEFNDPNSEMYRSDFSIAFAHLVHYDPGIFELFMLLYFRPYNSLCLHIDPKARPIDKQAFLGIFCCYKERYPHSKLYLADPPVSVYHAHISVMDAELLCAKMALEEKHKDFDVFVNLAGTELPGYPYEKFEEIMKRTGVRNIVGSVPINKSMTWINSSHQFLKQDNNMPWQMEETNVTKSPPPHSLKIFQGLKNVVLNPATVKFMLYNQISLDLYDWLRDMRTPPELFYATLIRVVQPTGQNNDNEKALAVKQDLETKFNRGICTRMTKWQEVGDRNKCHGFFRNVICVLGVPDLNAGRQENCLVLNKFSTILDSTVAATFCQVRHLIRLMAKSEYQHMFVPSVSKIWPLKE